MFQLLVLKYNQNINIFIIAPVFGIFVFFKGRRQKVSILKTNIGINNQLTLPYWTADSKTVNQNMI